MIMESPSKYKWLTISVYLSVLILYPVELLNITCEKIDSCSCAMSDGSGIVNLTSLGNEDGSPRFKDIVGEDGNLYSYNPCFEFTEDTCSMAAGCQTDPSKIIYFRIGFQSSLQFQYDDSGLTLMYNATNIILKDMFLNVKLVCKEETETPLICMIGEKEPLHFHAELTTKCACPGLCGENPHPPKTECRRLDQCSCEMNDGSRKIDLRPLGNMNLKPRYKLRIAPDNFFYSFNPCYPFNEGDCTNAAMCQISGDQAHQYLIGNSSTASFKYDGNNVHVQYTADGDSSSERLTDVTLLCDESATEPQFVPTGETEKLKYVFNFTSKCFCPKGC